MSVWHEIVEVARYAPSPHNTQPWKLRLLDERRATLFMVRSRMLPDEDVTGCFLLCAMGIFIESVRIVSANSGRGLEVEPIALDLEDGGEVLPFATLTLHEDESAKTPFTNELFLKRCTSRLPPSGNAVTSNVLKELEEVTVARGQLFQHTSDADLMTHILEKNTEAVFHDLNDSHYHDEIAEWFRFGWKHEQRTRDGLASRCMNMTAMELYLTARFPWLLTAPFARPLMRALYHFRLGRAVHIGWLAGEFWNRSAAERAGAALLHIWLTMAKHDIFMHPFGNLVTNAAAHKWLSGELNQDGIWIVFRFGHTARPPRSLRLETKELFDA